jgi:predicted Fe-S protein YdhL (DUF1289 family)
VDSQSRAPRQGSCHPGSAFHGGSDGSRTTYVRTGTTHHYPFAGNSVFRCGAALFIWSSAVLDHIEFVRRSSNSGTASDNEARWHRLIKGKRHGIMDTIDPSGQSPCIRDCCLGDDLTCLGCFRSLDEIKEWGLADAQRRQMILQNTKHRREAYQVQTRGSVG